MPIITSNVQAVRTARAYVVNIAATSTFATQACNATFIRLSPKVACCYFFASSSATTCATTDNHLAAGVVEFVKIVPGQFIHVISSTGALEAAGLTIAEVTE